MDVFSLLKFWRNAGGGDSSIVDDDDDESLFDLVFTNSSGDENAYDYNASPNVTGDSRFSFRFSSPGETNLKNRRVNSPLDSTKTKAPQSPLRLLKLGFQNSNKSKLESKLESEEVKMSAFLNRDNSLRHKLRTEKLLETDETPSKRFSKDVVNKYLNMMKPSYVKASNRRSSGEKSRLSERSNTPSSSPASSVFSPRADEKKSGGRGAVFREVRKHLGKSRSASAILQTTPATKSDDSAFQQQQDGIQGAILHCKRSYNSPSQDCILSRSGSAPSNNQARVSMEEEEEDKRSSI